MELSMVIPSYWGRESGIGYREGDAVYDHPTPIDEEGKLRRALQSTKILDEKDFQLIVIAVATSEDLKDRVEKKVADIVSSVNVDVETILFGYSHLRSVLDLLASEGKGEYGNLIQLRGYSNIRNICLLIPHVLGADVAVLIDDDEVFEDSRFISKVKEVIGRKYDGKTVHAVAGYYLQPSGDYHVKISFRPWMRYWNLAEKMNEAFDKVIGSEPRLKETPFIFGGNMVIHSNLFASVPFDPHITRGEDIDYLINSRMFGFDFFLDNELAIKHMPPPSPHPLWRRLRQDIYRFIYEREKLRSQREVKGMTIIQPEDLDPYPGAFLKDDLDEKIYQSCTMLALEYLLADDKTSAGESLNNIVLASTDAPPKFDPFTYLISLQKRWKELIEFMMKKTTRSEVKEILEV